MIEGRALPEALDVERDENLKYIVSENAENKVSEKLSRLIKSDNIAEFLDKEILGKIGRRCHDGYDRDEKSREDWIKKTEEAIKLAKQIKETKTFPFAGAANIKLPFVTDAAIKFAARAYAEIIKDEMVVKAAVIGADEDGAKSKRATRVSDYMSWQLTTKEKEWESDTDKLLHMLAVVGHIFRKRYYCSSEKRTKSEICLPDAICVNVEASNLETARRITHVLKNVSGNEIISNRRSGVWLDVELQRDPEKKAEKIPADQTSEEEFYCFLEQHCWLDLDDDNFEEPYIVTLEKESQKVVRIVARFDEKGVQLNTKKEVISIKPICTFTDYIFIPDLGGDYYGMGFGHFLEPLNKAANSIVNQLIDAGTLSNSSSGYLSREIKIIAGEVSFKPNEWKYTDTPAQDLAKGIFPLPVKEPSPTLYNLLSLMIDLIKDLSSVKDVLAGDAPGSNVPATTVVALIEQGMKTFSAIYKRIYRALKKEFEQLYALNYMYLDEVEYFTVLDTQSQVLKSDFEPDSMDIKPISDPTMASDTQRLMKAEALKSAIGTPGIDPKPIQRKWLEALKISEGDIEKILPEQDPNGVPPHLQSMIHDLEKKQADLQIKEQELLLKEREVEVKEMEVKIKAFKAMPEVMKLIAETEAIEPGQQLQAYKQLTDIIFRERQDEFNTMKEQNRIDSEARKVQAEQVQQAQQGQSPIEGLGQI